MRKGNQTQRERERGKKDKDESRADRWINSQINVDNLKRRDLGRDDRDKKITQTERAHGRKRDERDREETDETS